MDTPLGHYWYFTDKRIRGERRPLSFPFGPTGTRVVLVFTSAELAMRGWEQAGFSTDLDIARDDAAVICSSLRTDPIRMIDRVVVDAVPGRPFRQLSIAEFAALGQKATSHSSGGQLNADGQKSERDAAGAIPLSSVSNRPSLISRIANGLSLVAAAGLPYGISRLSPLHDHVVTIVMLLWIGVFAALSSYLVARAVLRGGVAGYLWSSLIRDLRLWILLLPMTGAALALYFADELGFGWPAVLGGKGLLYLSCINVARAVAPPQILLLHSFDDRNYPFAARLSLTTWTPVISLCPRHNPVSLLSNLEQIGAGQGAKFASDANWRRVVQWSMQVSDVIVMDLSHARAGLHEEIRLLCDQPANFAKSVFVGQDESAVINGYKALRDARGADVPVYSYGHLLQPGQGRLLANWGELGRAIRGRIGTQLATTLVGIAGWSVLVGVLIEWFEW